MSDRYASRPEDLSLFRRAMVLAVDAHDGQFRKGEIGGYRLPYVFHSYNVAQQIWKWGCANETMLAAAVLHDVIEDTNWRPATLLWGLTQDDRDERVNPDAEVHPVISLVEELTCSPDQNKEDYLAEFANPTKKSVEALVIKVADRLCNAFDFSLIPETKSYAQKYLIKGEPLSQAIKSRSDELVSRFGEPGRDIQTHWAFAWNFFTGMTP